MTIFGPGAAIRLHTHNCAESVLLLEGGAIAEIDGEQYEIAAGDIPWIPEGVPHRFIDASDTEAMRILWIYARLDATRTLVATGETRPVLAEHRD